MFSAAQMAVVLAFAGSVQLSLPMRCLRSLQFQQRMNRASRSQTMKSLETFWDSGCGAAGSWLPNRMLPEK